MVISSSMVEFSVDIAGIIMDFFKPLRWDHHIASKHQAPVTQWHGTIFQRMEPSTALVGLKINFSKTVWMIMISLWWESLCLMFMMHSTEFCFSSPGGYL
jgi:hypothetical protein